MVVVADAGNVQKFTRELSDLNNPIALNTALQLHRAIAGERLGGVGPGVSPKMALSLGLEVDVAALPRIATSPSAPSSRPPLT